MDDYWEDSYENDYGSAEAEADSNYNAYEEEESRRLFSGINCDNGIIVPLWPVTKDLLISDRFVRGLIYFLVLVYLFLGVAIYLNKLMESMETMTSLMKRISVPDQEAGKTQVIIVKIWNQTAANLFMVLGSSSPLILLGIFELFSKGFYAGYLGPSTIMGSSAFNLFVAIGVSISAVPRGQVRKIKNLGFFVLIAVWTFILYPCLYFPLCIFSYGEIRSDESIITIIFFLVIILSTATVWNYYSVGRRPKHESAITEYKTNFQLYKLVRQNILCQSPGISDNDLLQKVLECGVCKSWAYYVSQATNKIAGRSVLENLETSSKEKNEATMSFDKNGESVTMMDNPNSEEGEQELKTKVDSILLRANNGGIFDCNLWLQQFKNLVSLQHMGGSTPANCIIHVLTWPWKLMAAFIPPGFFLGGFVAFVFTLVAIFKLTILICDISMHLGCFIYCKDFVTGFILLSIGLNIPNMIAAKLAAAEEETADLPILYLLSGNLFTASLGFGLPWLFGSIYWEVHGQVFTMPVGSLGFCITMFFLVGMIAIIVLLGRRCCAGGELGGNQVSKIITTIVFFLLWLFMVLIISLEAYGIILPGS